MSFFPKTFVSNDSNSFHPLFRLLDDFDSYARTSPNTHHSQRGHTMTFSPKFDVKEVGNAYELHGELPGIEQSQVDIEFTDAQTLLIRGRSERSYTSASPSTEASAAITEGEAQDKDHDNASHHATVEDDEDTVNVLTPRTTAPSEVAKQEQKPREPAEKYWVSERSVGEFSRSFTFPVRVDSENVKASMKNGILSITVPKAPKDQARKITIA
jgi:HSP20 family protein